jgi:uncharacterized protein (TIGR03086 family)
MQMIDLERAVGLDRIAVVASAAVVGRCDDLTRPTPCDGWSLGDLLAHMTVQHHGFARAAAGEVTTVADWRPQPIRHAVGDYVDACAHVLGSFAAVAEPAAPVVLPEIRDEPIPAQMAIGFHLLDYVVHTWDVAVCVGCDMPFGPDVLDAAVAVARQVPDGAARDRPGAAFAHALPSTPGASALEETLRLTGRDPDWRPR